MDLAKTLIRTVARAFYPETKHVLVVDALMVHSALPNEDLALLLGMQQKDLRKLCGKLKEDRLLAVHSRQETREGQQRPINKDYYYIDFHATIDAIKYRIFYLTQRVKDLYKPSDEKKDFFCPRCRSQYTTLEVLDSVGPMGFLCHKCGAVLEERDDRNAGISAGHEKQSKLASQLSQLLKLLQQIDSEDIPSNDFETAFSVAVPVQRNEFVNPIRNTEPLLSGRGLPTAVKGVTENVVIPLEVSLTTSSKKTTEEQAAEAQRKANLAAQNSLPVWHTNSTVTGESTAVSTNQRMQQTSIGPSKILKTDDDEKKEGHVLNDELAAYYAQMAQEKAKEEREDRETDESSGDEDEDEFEDVGIHASAAPTPSSSVSVPAVPFKNGRKRGSESGSSGPGTNRSTPAGSGAVLFDEESDEPAAKKVKIEGGKNGVVAKVEQAESRDSDEDEEDEEFEDAL